MAIMNSGRNCLSFVTIVFALLFIISTPAGVACVMYMDKYVPYFKRTEPGPLFGQAAIAGAFIYIACSNLLSNEFQASRDIGEKDKRHPRQRISS